MTYRIIGILSLSAGHVSADNATNPDSLWKAYIIPTLQTVLLLLLASISSSIIAHYTVRIRAVFALVTKDT
jgi:hypothetical protein